MTAMTPLRITAHLEAGVAWAHTWGLALDGILAAQLHHATKAASLAAGEEPPPALQDPHPPDLPLPLARCGEGKDWHWCATTAYPLDGHGLLPDPRYWSARADHNALEQTAAELPQRIRGREGRYRHRWSPLLVTVCTAVTWTAVGDVDEIRALLEPIAAIGKKRAAGHGRVLTWDVTTAPELTDWAAGHTHPDGSLGRPVPAACLVDHLGDDVALGQAGIRPPYVHPDRQRLLCLPHTPTRRP